MRFDSLHQLYFLGGRFVVSRRTDLFADPSLQHFQVRKNQLHVNRLNISKRVDGSIYMDNITVFKAPHDMDNSIHLTNVGKELVSKSLSFGSPFHEARDIHKFDNRRNDLFRVIHLAQNI